jgi:hypothetical protein
MAHLLRLDEERKRGAMPQVSYIYQRNTNMSTNGGESEPKNA